MCYFLPVFHTSQMKESKYLEHIFIRKYTDNGPAYFFCFADLKYLSRGKVTKSHRSKWSTNCKFLTQAVPSLKASRNHFGSNNFTAFSHVPPRQIFILLSSLINMNQRRSLDQITCRDKITAFLHNGLIMNQASCWGWISPFFRNRMTSSISTLWGFIKYLKNDVSWWSQLDITTTWQAPCIKPSWVRCNHEVIVLRSFIGINWRKTCLPHIILISVRCPVVIAFAWSLVLADVHFIKLLLHAWWTDQILWHSLWTYQQSYKMGTTHYVMIIGDIQCHVIPLAVAPCKLHVYHVCFHVYFRLLK